MNFFVEPPPDGGEVPGDLEDQSDLVESLRISLFPQLYEPGHAEANHEGYLRIDRIGPNQHDTAVGLARGALWAKHIAWNLRHLGVGMVKAKPGSGNRGGPTVAVPEGFTTDIVATADGVHWDFQQDSAGGGYPQWIKEDDPINYPPVASRWVPAFPPDTP